MIELRNPYNNSVIKKYSPETSETLQSKVSKLKAREKTWETLTINKKLSCARNFVNILEKNIEKYSIDLSLETGKPIQEARGEIKGVIPRLQFFIDHVEEVIKDIQKDSDVLRNRSLGTIVHISAWNYPYLVGLNVIFPALLTGNCVLYKPSEYTLQSGENIVSALYAAGFSENELSLIIGKGDVGAKLLKEDINGVFFTGSYKTGMSIKKQLADKLIPIQLELGSNDGLYLAEDALELPNIFDDIASGCFYNAGQSCCSVERLFVHEKIYDKFINGFIKSAKKYVLGNPIKEETSLGPLTRREHIKVVKSLLEDAKSKGAKVLLGEDFTENGMRIPLILENCNLEMDVFQKESFAPMVSIAKVFNDEEAIEMLNSSPFGLTSGVYTKDKGRALRIIPNLDAGNVYWNHCDRVSPFLPWSGWKNSGQGISLSIHGIQAFLRPQGIHL